MLESERTFLNIFGTQSLHKEWVFSVDIILCSKLSTIIVSPRKASVLIVDYTNKPTSHFYLADSIIEVGLHMWLIVAIFEKRRESLDATQKTRIFLIVLNKSVSRSSTKWPTPEYDFITSVDNNIL